MHCAIAVEKVRLNGDADCDVAILDGSDGHVVLEDSVKATLGGEG